MKITVTENDISKGHPRHCTHCPIALAFRRQGFEEVRLSSTIAEHWHLGILQAVAKLPPAATAFINIFDTEGKVQPFSFDIEWEPVPVRYPSF